ncbi:metal ABC transporter solute-binding protein, Zn/Mn family [Patulibacter minatonensis]|uniref:metal ABC transporter solute-binding protein, Zn/Mn family n=1 Tax=Patulibacter minatonensis TaxID=298163 RepID=UPI0006879687|nr:zinc ABC transporter substrate-binding protein [Patulibacter minatonensis]
MLEPFSLPFVQRGLWEVLLLSGGAGVLGTWIVLRGLSFYAHGVAAATFPGLVLAAGLGFAGPLGAFGVALLFALTVGRLAAKDVTGDHSTLTAMVLVGALATGVVLASDAFPRAANVTSLLFGSLLVISDRDLVIAGAVSVFVLGASVLLGPRWLAVGFDRAGARSTGVRAGGPDALLLLLVAVVAVATLSAVGSLLAAAVMVMPAAATRPWVRRLRAWQLSTVALTAVQGVCGLWLSARTNAPPGATIAVLAGATFAVSVGLRALHERGLTRGPGVRATAAASLALVVGAGIVVGGTTDDARGDGRLRVVATTTQLADLARNVGGDRVDVHQVLHTGSDPHEYEPRPTDVVAAGHAKVVLASGLGLDDWIDDVTAESGDDAPIVRVGEAVPTVLGGDDRVEDDHAEGGHDHGDHDPHWWHDPRNVEAAIDTIRDALVRADPAGAVALRRNAGAYLAKVRALDGGIRRCVDAVPAGERTLVTSHDAFGYFTRRYGIRVVGAAIPSQTTQAQASAGDVARLAALVRRERVRAIFPEDSVNPKLADALAKETGATVDLKLYGDTLGGRGSAGATYLGMEQHNADAVVRGFTGGARGCRISL